MATEQNPPNHTRSTRIHTQSDREQYLSTLEVWLTNLMSGGHTMLFVAPTTEIVEQMMSDEITEMPNYGMDVQFVDTVVGPWQHFESVRQFVFVCGATGQYFVIRYNAKTKKFLASRTCKKRNYNMAHNAMIGRYGRLGFDPSGSYIWVVTSTHKRDGIGFFPNKWDLLQSRIQPQTEEVEVTEKAEEQKVHGAVIMQTYELLRTLCDAATEANADEQCSVIVALIESSQDFNFVTKDDGSVVITLQGCEDILLPDVLLGDDEDEQNTQNTEEV